jgi:hypothetical protein
MADEYLIPVVITKTQESFVVVKLRATSRQEAERRARDHVCDLAQEGTICDFLDVDCFMCSGEIYEENGIDRDVSRIEDYAVDIDITEEQTDSERDLVGRQAELRL